MKTINSIHTLPFKKWIFLMLLPLTLNSCLYEEPVMTSDGQLGVDPTEVTITANLSINLKLTEADKPATRAESTAPTYRHRFVIEAYLNREVAARQVVYEDLAEHTNLNIPVSMKLHARNYQLVVWSDYVEAGSEEDLHYDTQEGLMTVFGSEPYQGNTDWKDVFCASQELDLSELRNEWSAKIPVKMELKRPVARYELIANDVATFLRRIANGDVTGKKFSVRVKYDSYLPVGYNALDNLPKHALMYMQYKRTITAPAENVKELCVGFDYVFASGQPDKIPVTIEVVDEKSVTIARTSLSIPCHPGKLTQVRSAFLTADPNGGIGFDPDYDGNIDVDLGDL